MLIYKHKKSVCFLHAVFQSNSVFFNFNSNAERSKSWQLNRILNPQQIMLKHSNNIHNYHLISALAQVNPLPKAAKQIKLPSLTKPFSQASHKAIGIEAAVVLPYF